MEPSVVVDQASVVDGSSVVVDSSLVEEAATQTTTPSRPVVAASLAAPVVPAPPIVPSPRVVPAPPVVASRAVVAPSSASNLFAAPVASPPGSSAAERETLAFEGSLSDVAIKPKRSKAVVRGLLVLLLLGAGSVAAVALLHQSATRAPADDRPVVAHATVTADAHVAELGATDAAADEPMIDMDDPTDAGSHAVQTRPSHRASTTNASQPTANTRRDHTASADTTTGDTTTDDAATGDTTTDDTATGPTNRGGATHGGGTTSGTSSGHATTTAANNSGHPSGSTTTSGHTSGSTATSGASEESDGCDQATCVLDNFARPCCARYKPRPKDAVPYELDRAAITSAMANVKAAVIRCGEQSASIKGIVKIAVTVGGNGRVSDATVSETPDAVLGSCVAGVVRKATFAQTETGASFTYPFKF